MKEIISERQIPIRAPKNPYSAPYPTNKTANKIPKIILKICSKIWEKKVGSIFSKPWNNPRNAQRIEENIIVRAII